MDQPNQPIQPNITPDPQPEVSIKPSLPKWGLILIIIAGVIVISTAGYVVYKYFGFDEYNYIKSCIPDNVRCYTCQPMHDNCFSDSIDETRISCSNCCSGSFYEDVLEDKDWECPEGVQCMQASAFYCGEKVDQTVPVNEQSTDWEFVDANSFTLSLPPGWKFNKLQGIDSYVGEFVGDGVKLGFDFGWYSNSLTEENDPNHIVTYETIDGYRAKIVVPKITGNGTTGVYFGDLGGEIQKTRFNVYGQNLAPLQQETALKIFRTIRFIK